MRKYTLLAALCVVGSAHAQEKLAWKFKEGDRFFLEEKTLSKQTIKVLGNTEEREEAQTNLFSFLVRKKADDGVLLEQTIEDLRIDTIGKGRLTKQRFLDKMHGHQFTFHLNKKGQITSFEGYETLIDKLAGDDARAAKIIGAIWNADLFKHTAGLTFSPLPDGAVIVGDTWKRESIAPMGPLGGFKMGHTYKYEGEENGLAVISSTATLDYVPPGGDGAVLPFKILKGDLKARNTKSRLLFDHRLGRPSLDTGSFGIRGTLTLEILNNMPVEMEMDLEQTSVLRVFTK